jgi:hypothetical protein
MQMFINECKYIFEISVSTTIMEDLFTENRKRSCTHICIQLRANNYMFTNIRMYVPSVSTTIIEDLFTLNRIRSELFDAKSSHGVKIETWPLKNCTYKTKVVVSKHLFL